MAETSRSPEGDDDSNRGSEPRKRRSEEGREERKSGRSRSGSAPRAEPSRKRSGAKIVEAAVRQLAELTSKQVEAVVGLEKTEDGWKVEVEVLELRRVPNTTDVLATYEVLVDGRGALEGYRRSRRFVRGTPGDDQP